MPEDENSSRPSIPNTGFAVSEKFDVGIPSPPPKPINNALIDLLVTRFFFNESA